MSTNLFGKKLVIVAVIAAGAVAAVLVASSIAQATAQQQQQKMMMWAGEGIPEINGSVSVVNETMNFINENVKVPFVTAAETAQGQVADGKVIGGHLGVVQGYLVYKFFVANTANQTGYLVIVDAGNGEVLYTSESHLLGSFGPMSGHWGGHGYGGWNGPWKGHGWGMWR
jgi:uncharacterized membrane protein YkoI